MIKTRTEASIYCPECYQEDDVTCEVCQEMIDESEPIMCGHEKHWHIECYEDSDHA